MDEISNLHPEGNSNLPSNYGTIDLKAIKQSTLSLNNLVLGFSVDRSGSMGGSPIEDSKTAMKNSVWNKSVRVDAAVNGTCILTMDDDPFILEVCGSVT